jgi:hypothetical protein
MTFLHFSLLAGAGLIALPIVLHLIMRRKPRHLEFPALRFIQQRHDRNQRQLKLRHLLLLLLRALAIALLAAALARPSVRPSLKLPGGVGSQEAPVAAVLVFDTAARMNYRQDNRSRLEVARDFGLRLIAQLPKESRIAILDTRLGLPVFQVDRGAAVERVEHLETAANSQPLTRVIEDGLRLLGQSELSRKEIYIFSDLTQSAWPADAAGRLQDRLADTPGAGIYVIDVGVDNPVNFSLSPLRFSSGQIISKRSSMEVEATLSAVGAGGQRTVEMYLEDRDHKPVRAEALPCSVEPGKSCLVQFKKSLEEPRTYQGFIRITGEDGLADDDARFFTVEVKPPWRVLMAAPPPVKDRAKYLSQAIAPAAYQKQGRARFDCDVISVDQLAAQSLDPYAAVCLLDPTPLDALVWQKLGNYAAEGHGVAIFLGRHAQPILSFNDPKAQELLAGRLVRQARAAPEQICHLAPREYQHPILGPFRALAGHIPWDLSPVFRYWELDRLAAGASVIVPYSDDRPAILERPVGAGKAITMTTPVSDRGDEKPWNELPYGEAWPFVITVHQMMLYLVGSADAQLNYFAGQAALLPLERQDPRGNYLITEPPKDLLKPQETTKYQIPVDSPRSVLTVTATDQPGNYHVEAGGDPSGVRRGFSVNLAPEQTQLSRLPKEKLKELFGPFEYRLAQNLDQLDRQINTARVGRELFPLLILIVALVLGAEHVLANKFYRSGQ